MTADQYARILRLEGYEVRAVESAEEGLLDVQMNPPDVILVDFGLPNMDGLAFLRRLRMRPDSGTTPVAIVTGDYGLEDATSTALQELHAVVYFKPLWLEDLTTLVQGLLNPVR